MIELCGHPRCISCSSKWRKCHQCDYKRPVNGIGFAGNELPHCTTGIYYTLDLLKAKEKHQNRKKIKGFKSQHHVKPKAKQA